MSGWGGTICKAGSGREMAVGFISLLGGRGKTEMHKFKFLVRELSLLSDRFLKEINVPAPIFQLMCYTINFRLTLNFSSTGVYSNCSSTGVIQAVRKNRRYILKQESVVQKRVNWAKVKTSRYCSSQ